MIWPFKTKDRYVESLEWKTDVIRTKNGEQRFAIRPIPRTTYSFTHVLTETEYNAASALVRKNETFQVPDWSLAVNVGAVASGSSVAVNYGEHYAGIDDGDTVMLWESVDHYEACTIESDDSSDNFVLTTVANNYTNARLVPTHNAKAPNGLIISRKAGPFVQAQIEFMLSDGTDLDQSTYTKYKSHDVITDCPVIADETFAERIVWPKDAVDNEVGYPVYLDPRSVHDAMYNMRWHALTRAQLYTIRRFLHSRKGRWKSFYLSSHVRDFELALPIGTTDTTIIVFAPNGVTDLGMTTFDIEIGGTYYRDITSYNVGTSVNGKTTLDLNFATSLGVNLDTSTRISYLRYLRFDADRVELQHMANAGTSITVPCIEL